MRFANLIIPMLAGLACAAGGAAAETPGVHERGEVRYVSGGIGEQERRALDALAASMDEDFDTKIHLSAASGHYLADAHVRIIDEQGRTLVDTQTEGPLMLVDLPEGRYTVEARNGSATQGTTIEVSPRDGVKPLYLAWTI
ncbi:hypothetical protein [Microbulbifer yueqingensis]|uniref:Carboxypeptidase regulatory-like domain-containing protein n=1 Tax=Microbulbifer yueqingensis TaxID=658219 RepID=A0A1G9AIW3_9GAMM|nr:hypothetical protein [Microbulbifer yueqingensis]SDK27183.1 hypothetical protein SAMN05216212_2033 [Microbulbifer yueqingensis]